MRFERPVAVSPRLVLRRKRTDPGPTCPARNRPRMVNQSRKPQVLYAQRHDQHCCTAAQLWRVPCWMALARVENSGQHGFIGRPNKSKIIGTAVWRGSRMSVGRSLFAATLAGALALSVSPALSQTLRYANQGDLKSLDPYSLNESTTHAH